VAKIKYIVNGGSAIKKLFLLPIFLILLSIVATTLVWAGDDQNQGDVGQGDVDQGDTGNAPGSNAQGNQT